MPFAGIFTPLVMPIDEEQRPDLESLRRLIRFQLANGVHGIWAMGTSAEFAAFDATERRMVIATTVQEVNGRVPVIANISDAGTRLAIRHGLAAAEAGVDAVAVTPPYYYPHSQDELLRHYSAIRSAVDLPLFIYNIPQTVRVRLDLATAERLVKEGVVAGIKDSQNDLEWFRQLSMFSRDNGYAFALFAGTRHLIDAAMLAGADGAIPSVANAFPALCVAVYEAAARGDFAVAAEVERHIVRVENLYRQITAGSRNATVLGLLKAVLHARGILATRELSLPLRRPEDTEIARLLPIIERVPETVASR